MTVLKPVTTVDLSAVSADAEPRPTTPVRDASAAPPPGAVCANRRVLDGVFAVLEALAQADGGMGLTALARASGLAKTSTYRLAEQLVTLGAMQRVDRHYYIGPRIARIGQRWQPDPVLRQAAHAPVHALAMQVGATASLRILYEDRLRVICATARNGHAYLLDTVDAQSTARTATGRVLYATQPTSVSALPDCWTVREWRQLRESLSKLHATVTDQQDAFPGICCVSAPVRWPDGTCAAAVTAMVAERKPPPSLPHLVVYAARQIGAALG